MTRSTEESLEIISNQFVVKRRFTTGTFNLILGAVLGATLTFLVGAINSYISNQTLRQAVAKSIYIEIEHNKIFLNSSVSDLNSAVLDWKGNKGNKLNMQVFALHREDFYQIYLQDLTLLDKNTLDETYEFYGRLRTIDYLTKLITDDFDLYYRNENLISRADILSRLMELQQDVDEALRNADKIQRDLITKYDVNSVQSSCNPTNCLTNSW